MGLGPLRYNFVYKILMAINELIQTGLSLAWNGFKKWAVFIAFVLVIAGLGWAVYAGIIRPTTKPNPSTTQTAESIANYTFEPHQTFFGCASYKAEDYKKDKK